PVRRAACLRPSPPRTPLERFHPARHRCLGDADQCRRHLRSTGGHAFFCGALRRRLATRPRPWSRATLLLMTLLSHLALWSREMFRRSVVFLMFMVIWLGLPAHANGSTVNVSGETLTVGLPRLAVVAHNDGGSTVITTGAQGEGRLTMIDE